MSKRNIKKQIKRNNLILDDVSSNIILELKEKIKKNIKDPRQKGKKVYKIWDIIIVVFLATICNCNSWNEIETFACEKYDFLRKYLKMTGGVPDAATYERVISLVSETELQSLCLYFLYDIVNLKKKKKQEIINIDGKQDKSSSYKRLKDDGTIEEIKNLNVLNAYSNNYNMCLYSIRIEDKTNEITAFPDIIKYLKVRNAVITVDALNTQTENCKIVKKLRGNYVFALKGNQGNFYENVKLYFDDVKLKKLKKIDGCYLHEIETRGNEKITYDYYQTDDIKWYSDYKDWKGLKTIGMVVKTIRKQNGEVTTEVRYYISSLDIDINFFSECIRRHWSVENKLHWQLDYTFKQDENTTVNKEALFGLQIIKKTVLALLNPIKTKNNVSMHQLRLAFSFNAESKLEELFNFYAKKPKLLERIFDK